MIALSRKRGGSLELLGSSSVTTATVDFSVDFSVWHWIRMHIYSVGSGNINDTFRFRRSGSNVGSAGTMTPNHSDPFGLFVDILTFQPGVSFVCRTLGQYSDPAPTVPNIAAHANGAEFTDLVANGYPDEIRIEDTNLGGVTARDIRLYGVAQH